MSLRWIEKRINRIRDSFERRFGSSGGRFGSSNLSHHHASEKAYEDSKPASFNISRAVFLQLIGGIYLVAFSSYFIQFEGLYGSLGILPVKEQLEISENLSWTLFPTLVRLHSALNFDVYSWCNWLSALGVVLSAFAAAGYGSVPVMFGAWVIYLSLVTVGDVFLFFQWDSLLLEAGFLGILYAPLVGKPSRSPNPPRVILWMIRILFFKLMLMSGVVKITSQDRVWLHMTALEYHFASQPIPTPLAWYLRQLHPFILQLGVAFTYIVEIPCAFLIVLPFRTTRHGVAVLQALFQVLIILSGNYGFFNLLTLVLCVSILDDEFWSNFLQTEQAEAAVNRLKGLGTGHGGEETPLLTPGSKPVPSMQGSWNQRPGGRVQAGMHGHGIGSDVFGSNGLGLRAQGPGGSRVYNSGYMSPNAQGLGLRGQHFNGGLEPMGSFSGSFGRSSQNMRSAGPIHVGSQDSHGQGGAFGQSPNPSMDRGLALQQLLGQSKPVQAAATMMSLVSSVDSSKFWSKIVGRGAAILVALFAVFVMFKLDVDGRRHPVAVEVLGAGVEWVDGRYVASRVWRGSVQYKKDSGPLLRMYKTVVGKTSTWVIGAEDKAVYYTHSNSVDPPVAGWVAASAAADPPPNIHLVWASMHRQLPLLDRMHLSLAFGPDDVVDFMSGILPWFFLLFGTGIAIVAGIDLSYAIIYGYLATRRILASPPDRPQRRLLVLAQSWMPTIGVGVSCVAAFMLLLAHMAAMAEIAPSLGSSLLQKNPSDVELLQSGPGSLSDGSGGLSEWAYSLLEPFSIANGYGLFRSMTGVAPSVLDDRGRVVSQVARPELILEVSMGKDCDSPEKQKEEGQECEWLPFEFHYKPGNVARAPPWVSPHMPRLDWQMWFAALSYDWQSTRWFPTMLQKLCVNEPAVTDLVGNHGIPFKDHLPNYLRVRKFLYDFTSHFEKTEVKYEAPKGESYDLQRPCSQLKTREECHHEAKHCQFHDGVCKNRVSEQHKIVSEKSPGWWNRKEGTEFSPVLDFKEFKEKGYLPAGQSLPNMPITYGGEYVDDREKLGRACESSCREYKECVGYTYLPSRGVCYLKAVSSPVRGKDCQKDCWYFGVVRDHVRLKHSYLEPVTRWHFVIGGLAFTALLILSQAPVFQDLQLLTLTDMDPKKKQMAQLRTVLFWTLGLVLVIFLVFYTSHHLGQVFVPYVLGAGTGMMLSCYLFHVETNLEQSPGYSPSCDLSDRVSCSKVAATAYSKLFLGTQNSLFGILYYFALIVLALAFELSPDSYWILMSTLGLTFSGVLVSLYLLYLSFTVICVICPVCLATHVINFSLFFLTLYITHMQRAFLEYDSFFLDAMAHSTKSTYGD